jgi:Tetratricopeptide repeat
MAMKGPVLTVLIVFAASVSGWGQVWQPPSMGSLPTGSPASAGADGNAVPSTVFLTGKVVVAESMPLPQPAAIQLNCEGHVHTEGYTDAKGYFTFQVSSGRKSYATDVGQAASTSGSLPFCELQADLPGFMSQRVQLSGLSEGQGMVQVGNIWLYPAVRGESNTISVTSAAAPGKAQKNFVKGCQEATQGKWSAAEDHFQQATRIYPKYAQAWLFLGRVQVQKGDLDAARNSFHEALNADSKFVDAYSELAQLALRSKQWRELEEDTDHLIQLSPMPQFWYLNSAANFELKQVDKAERSALQGLRVDVRQHIPQLQYLLGAILALKHDYSGAAEHIRHYLRLAPHATDAAVAQQQLQQLEKLSGAAE